MMYGGNNSAQKIANIVKPMMIRNIPIVQIHLGSQRVWLRRICILLMHATMTKNNIYVFSGVIILEDHVIYASKQQAPTSVITL
jgi:hypothetical protein